MRQRQIGGNPAGKAHQVRALDQIARMAAQDELHVETRQLLTFRNEPVGRLEVGHHNPGSLPGEVAGQSLALPGQTHHDHTPPIPGIHSRPQAALLSGSASAAARLVSRVALEATRGSERSRRFSSSTPIHKWWGITERAPRT